MLCIVGAVETTLKEDPRKQDAQSDNAMTILTRDRRAVQDSDDDDDDDDDDDGDDDDDDDDDDD